MPEVDSDPVVRFPGLSLPLDQVPVQTEVIEKLESLLEEARTGRVVALAYVSVSRDTMLRSNWVGDISRHLLGYGISRLQHEFIAACVKQDDEDA